MQGHADPHRHAADHLRSRRERIDDPPGREHPESPGDLDLTGIDVDSHLDEVGTKGVAGERLVGLDLGLGVEMGLRAGVWHAAGDELPQAPTGPDDRGSPGSRTHRATGQHRGRQGGIADQHRDRLKLNLERLGRDLGERGSRAGADVRSGDRDLEAAVGQRPGDRL